MSEKILCPECKISQTHFKKDDYLICTHCGISFNWHRDGVLKTNVEKSYYGKIYRNYYDELHKNGQCDHCNKQQKVAPKIIR